MRYLLAFISFCVITHIKAQTADYKEVAQVQATIAQIFELETVQNEGRTEFLENIKDLPAKHPLANLINNNKPFFRYILQHYSIGTISSNLTEAHLINLLSKGENIQKVYIDSLHTHKVLGKCFTEIFCRYLIAEGYKIKDYKADPKISITEKELIEIASGFFYLVRNSENRLNKQIDIINNNYKGKHTPDNKYLMIEAFCYQVITKHQEEENSISDDFNSAFAKVSTLEVENEEEIKNIRKLVQAEMQKSVKLKKILFREYSVLMNKIFIITI